ncbi:MAG: hypothetical protein ACXWT1_20030 [Methylobacter sp.]
MALNMWAKKAAFRVTNFMLALDVETGNFRGITFEQQSEIIYRIGFSESWAAID